MVQLTRLNNSALVVNSDMIKFVEQAPDTVITLVNGEKILVRESSDEVVHRVVSFRQAVLRGLFRPPDILASEKAACAAGQTRAEGPFSR
jgi:flagellar protein FlbD